MKEMRLKRVNSLPSFTQLVKTGLDFNTSLSDFRCSVALPPHLGLCTSGLGPAPGVCPHGILPSPQLLSSSSSSASSIQAGGASPGFSSSPRFLRAARDDSLSRLQTMWPLVPIYLQGLNSTSKLWKLLVPDWWLLGFRKRQLLSRVWLFATPWAVCSLPSFSVHGVLQARILEWIAISFPKGSFQPRMEPRSPALEADSWPSEPPRKLTGAQIPLLFFFLMYFLLEDIALQCCVGFYHTTM